MIDWLIAIFLVSVKQGLSRSRDDRSDRAGSSGETNEEEKFGILELSPEGATEETEGKESQVKDLWRKSSVSSIAGAMTNFFSLVAGKSRKEKDVKEKKPLLHREPPSINEALSHQHRGLSPIESSVTSYTPKSLSSSGHQWKLGNIDAELQQHTKQDIYIV
ncbi:hypothetical protein KUTeg_015767 [Tegillarca granosa]|uniref:Uncharacterized protein n=1 Tax=Tegillarca granosa TaxID=220873 RepID=A0ABQ9EN99_TEGGR|nr:hypothetical protein KUTeg_015767 [Tegillarca granosa]